MENKLHVVNEFEQAGGGCCVPSVAMLIKFFLDDIINFDNFYMNEGNLCAKDIDIIDGFTYSINTDNELQVVVEDEDLTVTINANGELEVVKA